MLGTIVRGLAAGLAGATLRGEVRRIIEALTLTAADAGDALVGRLRSLSRSEIQDYANNVTDPALRESVRRATALANMTPPVPAAANITPAGAANFVINGVRVVVRQDAIDPTLGDHAITFDLFD